MSKQKGIIKLKGAIGGISFYSSQGQDLAKLANGPTKERIASDPKYKRTLENNQEFAGSAKAAKAFRLSLGGLTKQMGGSGLTGQLTALFKQINSRGTGVRGQRLIELSENKALLKNFEFNRASRFSSLFTVPVAVEVNSERNSAAVQIPEFTPDVSVDAPTGATHFKLTAAIGVVSDYYYDSSVNGYVPKVPEQDSLGAIASSSEISLDGVAATLTLTPTLIDGGVMDSYCTVVVTLGIEFYQMAGGNFYLLAQNNGMKVIEVA